ncbi:MAG: hypothetical protein M3Y83_05295 [Actinomycetota bacterium]|nr:hypothetical protein [Actinomycetota bacterium]
MSRTLAVGAIAAGAALLNATAAHADRVQPVPIYGFYNVGIDFSKQTFNGSPTSMNSISYPTEFTTECDTHGCVARMDNSDDQARNPAAPLEFEYRWNDGRWETTGQQPYLCERTDPNSGVPATRSDYWIPDPDGSFHGERTLVVHGAGCPGQGPGTHWVPITLTPIDPPPS